VTLSDTLVDEFDVLALLAEQAVELLDVTAAWVLLSDQRGELRLTAGSSEHAELMALVAAQARQGPCRDCVDTGLPVASPDLTADTDRWPDFAGTPPREARGHVTNI
jgi:hypothetical protein